MIGVGVAEEAGLMAALIRKLVRSPPNGCSTFIIVLVGVLSSVATDAGYLILIPLGAAAFLSVGRTSARRARGRLRRRQRRLRGQLLITPLDGLLTEITNEPSHLVDPDESIGLTANLWFSIVSTLFIAVVVTIVTERMIEPRLGSTSLRSRAGGEAPHDIADDDARRGREAELLGDESRGLRCALYGVLGRPRDRAARRCRPARRCATPRPARSSATRRSWTA